VVGSAQLAVIVIPAARAATGALSRVGAQAELQRITGLVNQRLTQNPRLAETVLSRAEIKAAVDPRVARMQYGNAVERLVAREIRRDPTLHALFKHVGGANNPDFIGRGALQGMRFDITTSGEVGSHLARPYGKRMIIIIYQRAPWLP